MNQLSFSGGGSGVLDGNSGGLGRRPGGILFLDFDLERLSRLLLSFSALYSSLSTPAQARGDLTLLLGMAGCGGSDFAI